MSYEVLKQHIDDNPGIYAAMTDAQVVAELNTPNKTRNRTSMSGSEIYANTDSTEFNGLVDAEKSQWLSFCSISTVDPYGPGVDFVTSVFGGGSTTVANLQAARVETNLTQAEILGIGPAKLGHITEARS